MVHESTNPPCDSDGRVILTESDWVQSSDSLWMLSYLAGRAGAARRRHYLTPQACERKLRHFLIAVCRRVWSIARDARTRQAVETAERYVDGLATQDELSEAHVGAQAAYREVRSTNDKAAYSAASPAIELTRASLHFDHCQYAIHVAAMAIAEGASDQDEQIMNDDLHRPSDDLRDIFGNPFCAKLMREFGSSDPNAETLARKMYTTRNFSDMPQLADALESSGCTNAVVLDHCRNGSEHIRGCWVVSTMLGHV